ncbi:MAG: alpha/beta fold hydrolase [Nocardioides sp.]
MRTPTDTLLNRVQRPNAYREVVISSAGTPIVLSVWNGHPGRASVVFLPGTMTHPLFYEEFLDALNRTGLTVVGVHSQGHGKSPRAREPLTFARIVTNARDAVAWTRHEFPDAPIAVLGSSQGGVVAMALASAGEPLDIVIAHNILDPRLASSLEITRFPQWLRRVYPLVVRAFQGVGRLAPRVPVPFDAYLDIKRVCRDEANAEYFYTDPLGRRTYPLGFMATLFSADLSGMRDGSISCPVLVVASRGDPLFSLSYTRQVYESIVAMDKELLVLESEVHLLFNEDLDVVLPPLLDRLAHLQGAPA